MSDKSGGVAWSVCGVSISGTRVAYLGRDSLEVVLKLVVGGGDVSLTTGFEAGTTGATKDLEHVKDGEVDEGASRAVVDLGALDNDCI